MGAKVRIFGSDDSGNKIVRYRTVTSGGSFGGSSLRVEAGLGDVTTIDYVEVDWPVKDAATEKFTGLSVDQAYLLREGTGKAEPQKLKSFDFANEI